MIVDVDSQYDLWLNQLTPTERRCWLVYVNKVDKPRLTSPNTDVLYARLRFNSLLDGFRKEYTQYKNNERLEK